MQKLFNMDRGSNAGTRQATGWGYVEQALRTNLEKVIGHYQLYSTAVDASQILNRIITTIAFCNHYELRAYESLLEKSVTQYAGALGLTSSVSKGIIHTGEFYGRNSREVIIAHSERNYTLDDVVTNWQDISAVEVLHHPFTDLGLSLADGRYDSVEEGLSIIAINLPLLGLQYKMFKDNELQIQKQTGKAMRTMQQFIRCYVLTNMLKSHLDYAIFNRLVAVQRGIPRNKIRNPHPFGLISVDEKLDSVQEAQLEIISGNSYRFSGVMKNIPMINKPSLFELSKLPGMANTRQVLWALVPARLKMLSFLITVSGSMGRALNIDEIEHIKLTLRELNTSRVLRSALPLDLYFDAASEIEKIAPGA